jgi:hypothetical protein
MTVLQLRLDAVSEHVKPAIVRCTVLEPIVYDLVFGANRTVVLYQGRHVKVVQVMASRIWRRWTEHDEAVSPSLSPAITARSITAQRGQAEIKARRS